MEQRIFILSIYQWQGFVLLMAPSLYEGSLKHAGEVPTACGAAWLAYVRNGECSLTSCSAHSRRLPRLIFKTFCIRRAVWIYFCERQAECEGTSESSRDGNYGKGKNVCRSAFTSGAVQSTYTLANTANVEVSQYDSLFYLKICLIERRHQWARWWLRLVTCSLL